jgi:eukaryotic-like serine/threonine-protein kinase
VTALGTLQEILHDRYVFERELGRGGIATVYLVEDRKHERRVALKVMHPDLARSLGPERFLREVRTTARLQHPHILPMLDSGETHGFLWYTMPHVRGESLRQRLKTEVQLSVETALEIARQVGLALDHAHREGVVHRDLKPENILLSEGQALVADFGVAKALEPGTEDRLTEPGLAVGTPAYMSPEQASGAGVDARTDIYSLGCILYEMLAGEPPYTGPTPQAVIAKRLTEPIPRLRAVREVPPAVESAVLRALAKVPADRFQTAAKFVQALSLSEQPARLAMPTGPPRRSRIRTSVAFALGLLVIATAGLLVWQFRDRTVASSDVAAPAPYDDQPSVAVLPFANLSADRQDEYFSDGMTAELITALGRVEGLRVAPRVSSFAFKGQPLDVAEVSRKLNVGSVLDGSVRRSGRRLRVTAELVRASDGARLWAESYDRELQDVFAVQDDLARAIAGALSLRLAGTGHQARGTTNLAAYDRYLQAQFFARRYTEPDLRRSLALYEDALAKDSTYAAPWAGIARAWGLLVDWEPADVTDPRARAAALKALALDSNLVEAHAAMARVLLGEWDFAGAEQEVRRALSLNPNDDSVLGPYSDILRATGRLDSALVVLRRSRALDPLGPGSAAALGRLLRDIGDYEGAIEECRASIELSPGYSLGEVCLGDALLAAGRPAEALAAFRRAEDYFDYANAGIARAEVARGRPDRARRIVGDMKREAGRRYLAPDVIALAYVDLGEPDSVFKYLEQAYAMHASPIRLARLTTNRRWDPVRDDPRFAELVKKIGLTPIPLRDSQRHE